jgi:hypothetical protein
VGITAGATLLLQWGFDNRACLWVIVVLSVIFIDKVLKIDDPVGAIAFMESVVCGALLPVVFLMQRR